MFIPFITKRSTSNEKLYRRKGGGGGGKGGGGSSGGGKGSSGGIGGSTGSKGSSVPLSGKAPAGKSSATAYGSGGGKASTIPSGSLFAGRNQGGGSRTQIFGSRAYGSGYPGATGRGVAGRGFPFFFWPVVWGGAAGGATGAYLHDNEYGDQNNSSRPGGSMLEANFVSNSSTTRYHLLADNSTVTSLIASIDANCSSLLGPDSSTAPYSANWTDPASPQPEQAIQYYRASSIVLTLDGYNNSAVFSSDDNAPDTPLPSGIDLNLLDCLNQTIGLAAPLIDGAGVQWSAGPGAGAIGLFWVMWYLMGNMV